MRIRKIDKEVKEILEERVWNYLLVDIEKVKVGDRIRKDMGNLEELSEDIKKNGLINPPVVTPDYELIAGERRLQAMKNLGYKQVEVRVMTVENAEHKLNLEINENENRKDFNKAERIEYARQLERIERVKAKEREKAGVAIDPRENFPQGRTRDLVAEKLGIGSGKQYEKEKYIADNADDEILKAWNEEKISTHKAYTKVKELEKKLKEKDEEIGELRVSNNSLYGELQIEKSKAPEVVEKEVIKEVAPGDYELTKAQLENANKKLEKLMQVNQSLKEKEKLAMSKLESEQVKKKIVENISSFHYKIAGFMEDVGGLLYLTDYLDEMPKENKKLFLDSAKYLRGFSEQLYKNIEKHLKEIWNDRS